LTSPVTALKEQHDALNDHLLDTEPSLAVSTSDHLAKSLLLSAASELESRFQVIVIDFYETVTSNHEVAVEFVRNKAVKRQFHTYFTWDAANANSFFGLFGSRFKAWAAAEVKRDAVLEKSVRDFIQLGSQRNLLVHGNYGVYSLSLTVDEIHDLYLSAEKFLEAIPGMLSVTLPEEAP
jgi:hypothetical protein